MVSIITLPPEVLFQSLTGLSSYPLTHSAIREFSSLYCRFRLICKPLTKKIDLCWRACLESFWNDWKEAPEWHDRLREDFVKQLFSSSKLIVNWIDGTPKITKLPYKDIQNKQLILKFEAPVQGEAFITLESPIIFAETLSDNVCHDSYYFDCNKTIAVQINEGGNGSALFYKLDDMQLIGRVEGTAQTKVMPHTLLKPLLFEKTACIFTADVNLQINGFDHFVMDVYDVSSFSISKINQMELPFYLVTAYATKDHFVFFCNQDNSYMLGATSREGHKPLFVYSLPINPPCKSSRLVEIQGQLLLLSIKKKSIKIQIVKITSDAIHLEPVEIPGLLHLDIFEAYVHLDKLFVISYDSNYRPTLFVIDFVTKCMQTVSTLEFQWLNHGMNIVSSNLGVVQVFVPDRSNPHVITLDYT